ncbi:hypothetical protein N7G274_004105 [Stereocaulon virgatum]|uniref:Uncharacterized protein n=1 Tax=Stereocaulon virgatum TaxID=373712 RepID=A0ABR4AC51_9LECA
MSPLLPSRRSQRNTPTHRLGPISSLRFSHNRHEFLADPERLSTSPTFGVLRLARRESCSTRSRSIFSSIPELPDFLQRQTHGDDTSSSSAMCFLRINPASAPLKPPGAAPTLTTIYRETNARIPSEFESPATSQDLPVAKSEKRRRRLKFHYKPAPTSHDKEGMEMELRRVQTIADSLDHGHPNRVVKKEDARLDRWREDVTSGMPVGKRRSVG